MRNDKIKILTYMSLIIALTVCATILIRIPVPATQGYVHLGDAVLIISVLILGKKRGAVAGALGQSIADLIGGFAIFAPITFAAKLIMGILIGIFVEKTIQYRKEKHIKNLFYGIISLVLSCMAMVGIYYIAESAIYGSFIVPLVEIPANIIEFVVSLVIAGLFGTVLMKGSMKTIIRK